MQLLLFKNFSKRRNSTKQVDDSTGIVTDVVLKQGTSIESPVFLIQGVDLEVNYAKFNNHYFYIDDIVVMHKASYEDQLDMAKSLHNKNTYKSGYVDKTGIGSAFPEFAEKKVCSQIKGLQFTASNKTQMFENLRSRIFDHTLKINRKFKAMIELDFNNVQRIVNEAG